MAGDEDKEQEWPLVASAGAADNPGGTSQEAVSSTNDEVLTSDIARLDPFSIFPDELLLLILGFLNSKKRLLASSVSRNWRRVVGDEQLWRKQLSAKFDAGEIKFAINLYLLFSGYGCLHDRRYQAAAAFLQNMESAEFVSYCASVATGITYRNLVIKPIFYSVPEVDRLNFCALLERWRLKALAYDHAAFHNALSDLPERDRLGFCYLLGRPSVGGVVADYYDLSKDLRIFPVQDRLNFCALIGSAALRRAVTSWIDLINILAILPEYARLHFCSLLGQKRLRFIIREDTSFDSFLEYIPEQHLLDFCKLYGNTYPTSHKPYGSIYSIRRPAFAVYDSIFSKLPKQHRLAFCRFIGQENVRGINRDDSIFESHLCKLPKHDWYEFCIFLDPDTLRKMFRDLRKRYYPEPIYWHMGSDEEVWKMRLPIKSYFASEFEQLRIQRERDPHEYRHLHGRLFGYSRSAKVAAYNHVCQILGNDARSISELSPQDRKCLASGRSAELFGECSVAFGPLREFMPPSNERENASVPSPPAIGL